VASGAVVADGDQDLDGRILESVNFIF